MNVSQKPTFRPIGGFPSIIPKVQEYVDITEARGKSELSTAVNIREILKTIANDMKTTESDDAFIP